MPLTAVEEYFAGLDTASRNAFQHVRAIALRIVPDAQDGRSYGMAALRFEDKPLIGFRAAKDHLSIFPFSSEAVDAVRDRLTGFDLSKGTIRFSPDRPLPDDVLSDLIRHRLDEIAG
ncbi:iron chaperone [Streptomyces sp. NPDC058052]|uniref:iron chaperone n=1 Tax=Streptomyces sp. NPDC058052 TaxID=3346316 RepID=UPI0036E416CA